MGGPSTWSATPRPTLAGLAVLAAALFGGSGATFAADRHAGPPALVIDPTTLDATALDDAVDALVEGLLAAKDPDRFWEPSKPPSDESTTQAFGWTAIVLLALVEAGVSPQDPRISDAVGALSSASLGGTYAVATRTMLGAVLTDRHRRMLEADVRWLLEGFSPRSRGWDYVKRPNSAREDNSINQFASLALADAASRGVDVPERLWELLESRTLAMQRPDGGWTYEGRGEPRGSMTAAGVATLFMLDRHLGSRRRERRDVAEAIERGMSWLAARFDPDRNPGHPLHEIYWLFSLERAALAGGISRLGGRDWFREGAASLIERLCEADPDGVWRMRRETPRGRTLRWHEHALGLLFLLRGRVPVAIGVLEEGAGHGLDASRFAGGIVDWMADTAEREFNWLRLAPEDPVASWLEPALLWWAPRSAAGLVEGKSFREKVRTFLDLGGLLVADLGDLDPRERQAVRGTLADLRPGATWRDLDERHPALSTLFRLSPREARLETLSDGVRDLVVLDESGRLGRGLAAGPQRGRNAHEALFNLWMLAVEIDRPWPRLQRWIASSRADAAAPAPPILRVVDLATDAETASLEPLAPILVGRVLGERLGVPVAVERVGIDEAAERLDDVETPTLLLLRGVDDPHWPPSTWNRLEGLVRHGHVLLVETVGGNGTFATAVERELARRLERTAAPLVGDRLLAGDPTTGRADLRRSSYRPSTARRTGAARAACRLRGLRLDSTNEAAAVAAPPAVVVSTLDLSHAMLGRPREGIDGYDTSSASDLLERIARDLLAARLSPVPTGRP